MFWGSWTDLLATATDIRVGGGFVGAAVTAVHVSDPGALVNPCWQRHTPFLDLSPWGTHTSPGLQSSKPTSHTWPEDEVVEDVVTTDDVEEGSCQGGFRGRTNTRLVTPLPSF